jgi:hypothetical protein
VHGPACYLCPSAVVRSWFAAEVYPVETGRVAGAPTCIRHLEPGSIDRDRRTAHGGPRLSSWLAIIADRLAG